MVDLAEMALDEDTALVRDAHRFDEAGLKRWMIENVDGAAETLTVRQFKGGQSNPTYLITTANQSYVLRRQPPGLLLKGAHAVDREAIVQRALGGTEVPVARIRGICLDPEVIGTMFYVMDVVEGRIFWDATFPVVAAPERSAYFRAMNNTVVPRDVV